MKRQKIKTPSRSPIRKQLVKKIVSYYETLEKSKSRSKSRQNSISSKKKNSVLSPREPLKSRTNRAQIELYEDNLNRIKKLDKLKYLMKAELNKAKIEENDIIDGNLVKKAISGYPSFMQNSNKKLSNYDQENIHPSHIQKKVYQNLEKKVKEIESTEKKKIKTSDFEENVQGAEELYPLNTNKTYLLNNSADADSFDFHERKSKEIRRLQYVVKVTDSNSKSRGNSKRKGTSGKKRQRDDSFGEKILDISHQDIVNKTLKHVEDLENEELKKNTEIKILAHNISREEDYEKCKQINKILEIEKLLEEEKIISNGISAPKPIQQTSKKSEKKTKKKVLIPSSNLLEDSITRSPKKQMQLPMRHILSPKMNMEEEKKEEEREIQTDSKKSSEDESYPIWVKFGAMILQGSMTCKQGFKLSEDDQLLEVREGDYVMVKVEAEKLIELNESQIDLISTEFEGTVLRPELEEEDCQLVVENEKGERFQILIEREDELNETEVLFDYNCTFKKIFKNPSRNDNLVYEGRFEFERFEGEFECYRGFMVDEDNNVNSILVFVSEDNKDRIYVKGVEGPNNSKDKVEFKISNSERVNFDDETIDLEGYLLTLEDDDSDKNSQETLPRLVYYIKDVNIINKIYKDNNFKGEKGHVIIHDGFSYEGVLKHSLFNQNKEFILEINEEFSLSVQPNNQTEDIDIDHFLSKIQEIASELAESRRQRTEELVTEREFTTQNVVHTQRIENRSLEITKKVEFKIKNHNQDASIEIIQQENSRYSRSEFNQSHPNTSRETNNCKEYDETVKKDMDQLVHSSLNEGTLFKKNMKKRRSKLDRRKNKQKKEEETESLKDSLDNLSHSTKTLTNKSDEDEKYKLEFEAAKVEEREQNLGQKLEEVKLRDSICESQNPGIFEDDSFSLKPEYFKKTQEPKFEKRDSNAPEEEEDEGEKNTEEHSIEIKDEDIASESPQSQKRVPSKAQNTSNKGSTTNLIDLKNLDPVNKLKVARNKNSKRFIEEFNRSLDKIYYTTTNMKRRNSRENSIKSNSRKNRKDSLEKGNSDFDSYGGFEFNINTGEQTIGFTGYGGVRIRSRTPSAKKRSKECVYYSPENLNDTGEKEEFSDNCYFEDETPDKEKVTDVIKALRKLEDNAAVTLQVYFKYFLKKVKKRNRIEKLERLRRLLPNESLYEQFLTFHLNLKEFCMIDELTALEKYITLFGNILN